MSLSVLGKNFVTELFSRELGRLRHGPAPCDMCAIFSALALLALVVVAVVGVSVTLLSASSAQAQDSAPSWGAPMQIDGALKALTGVSCISSPLLCVAVDSEGNIVTSTDPAGGTSAWNTTLLDPGASLNSVSCVAGPLLCVAVDSLGNVLTSTNPTAGAGAWTKTSIDPSFDIASVSCASASLCVAVDNGANALIGSDPAGGASGWSPTELDAGNLSSVSCTAPSTCVVVDRDGDALTTTDPGGGSSTWSSVVVGSGNGLAGVSCISGPLLCVAGATSGEIATSSEPTALSSTWISTEIDSTYYINGVACTSGPLCVAVDQWGDELTSTDPEGGPSAWTFTNNFTLGITMDGVLVRVELAVRGGGQPGWRDDPGPTCGQFEYRTPPARARGLQASERNDILRRTAIGQRHHHKSRPRLYGQWRDVHRTCASHQHQATAPARSRDRAGSRHL